MELFFLKKKNLIFLIIISFLFITNTLNIFFYTPMVPDQHWAQKIFYLHVPSAWVGFLSYFLAMISGIFFLLTKKEVWDSRGLASAEIGTIFMALVLITGPIWATPIWGKPWIWEPRLTTTLILFLTYVGYFMIRSFGGNMERAKRIAASIAVIAFINVPIIFFSVQFWSPELQSHPQVEMNQQPNGILLPFFFSLFVFSLIYFLMFVYRTHVISIKKKYNKHV